MLKYFLLGILILASNVFFFEYGKRMSMPVPIDNTNSASSSESQKIASSTTSTTDTKNNIGYIFDTEGPYVMDTVGGDCIHSGWVLVEEKNNHIKYENRKLHVSFDFTLEPGLHIVGPGTNMCFSRAITIINYNPIFFGAGGGAGRQMVISLDKKESLKFATRCIDSKTPSGLSARTCPNDYNYSGVTEIAIDGAEGGYLDIDMLDSPFREIEKQIIKTIHRI